MNTTIRSARFRSNRGLDLLAGCVAALVLAACGSGQSTAASSGQGEPSVVVTTTVLGDVVRSIVGDAARVDVIMPTGADPHDFQVSAQQAAAMRDADVLVINGAGFEQGLAEVIDSAAADGADVYAAIDAVDALELDGHAAEKGHEDDEHGDVDPHFFTDPIRMADAARGIAEHLRTAVPALDTEELTARTDEYVSSLRALDDELRDLLGDIPDERRVLVTNHEVFAYFADRYDFEVVGTIVPSGGTSEGISGGELAELARTIEAVDVPAIFADTSSPTQVAEALADEVGDVTVVELYSESLGPAGSDGDTYLDMMRANGRRVADGLA